MDLSMLDLIKTDLNNCKYTEALERIEEVKNAAINEQSKAEFKAKYCGKFFKITMQRHISYIYIYNDVAQVNGESTFVHDSITGGFPNFDYYSIKIGCRETLKGVESLVHSFASEQIEAEAYSNIAKHAKEMLRTHDI